jgi:hypothetical protein
MTKRASTGKSKRFEVFKRDHFTCQYCGAQPPVIVLVVDHILPVCKGGSDDPDNLTTACEACNQGKAGKLLNQVPNRPDADLMYLEAQQEIAELKRYQLAKTERDTVTGHIVDDLQDTWFAFIYEGFEWAPAKHILRSMLDKYTPAIVEHGVITTAKAVAGGHVQSHGNHWVRYMWGVMRNVAEAQDSED